MTDLLRAVFLSQEFMPHGHCFLWKPGLVWLHVASDGLIGTAYVVISILLWRLVRTTRIPFGPMVVAFGLFIGMCGLTHYMEVLTLWVPDYWLAGMVKAVTAAASVATGVYLFQARSPIIAATQGAGLAEERRLQLERAHRDLEAAARGHERAFRALRECSEALVRATEEQVLLDRVCRILVEVAGHRMCWVGFPDGAAPGTVRPVAHAGDDAGYLSEIDPRTGAEGSTDPSARAFRTGRPVLVGDLLSDRGPEPWRSAAATRGFASLAAVPLVADGATLGVLTIYAADAQAFDDDEMELLRELADDLAFGIVALRGRVERERLTAQLMQADRMVATGTLAAGVAHEINNPLAYLIAALDFLEEELRGIGRELPAERLEEASQALAEAREGAGRVRHIVRDLRTFSRADDERQGPVDLRRVIESSINIAYNEIKHRARLVKDYGKTPPVLANEARLGQVFLNLLVNAAQAIPEGRAGENEIRVVTRIDDAGAVVVEVRDTGTGIAPEILGRIFDPFFTTKPLGVGTGLGLSICRNIVVALGGEIGVESRLGRGTVFRLRLPPAPAQTEEERPQPALAMGRRGRVLVVDDEPVVGKAVRRVLGPEHEVVVLTSAREAREKLAQGERFDAIICDLMMPEVTGMDLHAELTALAPDQAARMILLTGGAFTPRARQFLDQVPNPRVEKPFDSANLRAVVRGLVR